MKERNSVICRNCGQTLLRADAIFCSDCGIKIVPTEDTSDNAIITEVVNITPPPQQLVYMQQPPPQQPIIYVQPQPVYVHVENDGCAGGCLKAVLIGFIVIVVLVVIIAIGITGFLGDLF
jgi:hypothetical protein